MSHRTRAQLAATILAVFTIAALILSVIVNIPNAVEDQRRRRMKMEILQEIVNSAEARGRTMVKLAREGKVDGVDPHAVPVKR